MKETVKQRLIEYLKYKGIGQNKFEKMAGISNGYISNIKSTPRDEKLTRILQAAPDLNRIWLLTGDGEMLLPKEGNVATVEGDGTAVAGNSIHVEIPDIISKALDEIAAQRMLTEKSQSQVDKSQEQLDKAYEQVSKAQEQIDRLISLLEKQHQ